MNLVKTRCGEFSSIDRELASDLYLISMHISKQTKNELTMKLIAL